MTEMEPDEAYCEECCKVFIESEGVTPKNYNMLCCSQDCADEVDRGIEMDCKLHCSAGYP